MNRPPELDQEEMLFPPFQGFQKEALSFLKKLKKNNTREWFQSHKEEYEVVVKFPMQCLVAPLAVMLKSDLPNYTFNPKKSIFRIHRDVRFSKDKSPYKTNIAASFNLANRTSEAVELPGFYLHIEPKTKEGWGTFAGGGLYMPASPHLKAIREKIANESELFLSIIEEKTFKKFFNGIEGEKLKTNPKGYDPTHPMIEHLKHKQFFVSREFDEEEIHKPLFAKHVAETFRAAIPWVNFLNAAVRGISLNKSKIEER
jgi:uncharacterized protein (TIGR02453 family)